jgi:hypothetical protein
MHREFRSRTVRLTGLAEHIKDVEQAFGAYYAKAEQIAGAP